MVSGEDLQLKVLATRYWVLERGADVLKKFPAKKLRIFSHLLNIFLDLVNFLSRLLNLATYREVPKLFSQQGLRGLVDKTMA